MLTYIMRTQTLRRCREAALSFALRKRGHKKSLTLQENIPLLQNIGIVENSKDEFTHKTNILQFTPCFLKTVLKTDPFLY